MALSASLITTSILAAGPELQGFVWRQIAAALGSAVNSWALSGANLTLLGATTGVIGSGTVLGKFQVNPAPLPVPLSMEGHFLLGPNAGIVGRAVGVGVATAFNSGASYRGTSMGVGVGTDASKVVVSNGSTLTTLIRGTAASMGIQGVNMGVLSGAFGTGIATLLLAGTGLGSVTGVGGPSAAVGTSRSSVF